MAGLPPLIDSDMQALDAALDDLLRRSEAVCALLIDKGGPVICRRGAADKFDVTTIGALAAGSFCATEAIASRVGETNFSSIYQQGEKHSLLFCNVDAEVLLIVIFRADTSVGVVKYYSADAVARAATHLRQAALRSPGDGVDLVSMNVVDASSVFRRAAS